MKKKRKYVYADGGPVEPQEFAQSTSMNTLAVPRMQGTVAYVDYTDNRGQRTKLLPDQYQQITGIDPYSRPEFQAAWGYTPQKPLRSFTTTEKGDVFGTAKNALKPKFAKGGTITNDRDAEMLRMADLQGLLMSSKNQNDIERYSHELNTISDKIKAEKNAVKNAGKIAITATAYGKWKSSLPNNLQYEGDYDLQGYYNKYGPVKVGANTHLTDEFKLPNHPTFSDQSKYYTKGSVAGHWNNGNYVRDTGENTNLMGRQLPLSTFADGGGVGDFFGNWGKATADIGLSALGLSNVIKDDAYKGSSGQDFRNIGNVGGKIAGMALPIAANAVAPGSGNLVRAGQKAVGGFNPEDETLNMEQFECGGMVPKMAKGGWIKGAINPEHKGFCSPMTKETCTPRRKALAMRFKSGDLSRHEDGGNVEKKMINVEGNELEVNKGKVVADFKGKPKHPTDKSLIDMDGNTSATVGNTIIPSKLRQRYLDGDKITRSTIEANVRRDQMKREKDEETVAQAFREGGAYYKETYKDGGGIYIKPSHRGLFTKAANRAGYESVQEYASHVLANREDFSPSRVKQANFARNAAGWRHEYGGDVSEGYHMMPDGSMMANSEMYAQGGGLKRSEDYGTEARPYPSVAAGDFAGGGRSYPIPTRADAVDALRLAGLHGRADVKAKVYARYPELKKARGGYVYEEGGDIEDVSYTPGVDMSGWVDKAYDQGLLHKDQVDWKNLGYSALAYAPTAYNIGKGLFGKPEQLQTEKYQVGQRLPYRDINMEPVNQRILEERKAALGNLRGIGGLSQGSYLSNAAMIGANTARARAEAEMGAQQANIQGRNLADQYNIGIEQGNLGTALNIARLNQMSRAKKSEYLGKGLEGLSGIAQTNRLMGNQAGADQIRANTLQDLFDNYVYNPATKRMTYKR